MAGPQNEEKSGKNTDDRLAGMSPLSRAWVELAPYLNIGWVFAASIGLFAFLGWKLDQWRGGGQTWLAVGAVAGIAIGFLHFFKVVLSIGRKQG